MERLGDELISDILNRLQVEELSELIYVCKKWYCLIRQPYFMKTNLLCQQQFDNMLVQVYNDEEGVYESTIYSVRNGCLLHEKVIAYLEEWKIQATCNGLLLVQNCYQPEILAITNPVTESTICLPPCQSDMENSSFAFVFVRIVETYHVIHMFESNSSNSNKNIECWGITLKYDTLKEEMEGLRWMKLWGGNVLKNIVRFNRNPICLDNGIVVWKLDNDRTKFFAWDVGTGAACVRPLPGLVQNEPADGQEYFLVNKGGSLAFVDYDESYTVVRIRTLDWNTGTWTLRWVMGLSEYEGLLGFAVAEITPYYIAQKDILMVFGIDGNVFGCNEFGTETELGSLSGKIIMFCGNHTESIVSLKEALPFT